MGDNTNDVDAETAPPPLAPAPAPAPAPVTMIDPAGNAYSIAASDVDGAIRQGFRPETPLARGERLGDEQHAVTYGGIGNTVGAGVLALGRGATLGLSDLAVDALGGEEYARGVRDAHPTVSAAGQFVGALAPAFVAPESLLGRSPAGYLARAAAEATESAKALGGFKALAGVAAATGTEAAVQNAGMYLSDVALGDRDLTAEGLAGALGHGFAFGTVAGGAMFGIERGTIAARKMFSRVAEGGVEATTAAESAWTRKSDEVLSAGEQTADIAKQRLVEIRMAKEEASLSKAKAQAELAQAKLDAFRGSRPAAVPTAAEDAAGVGASEAPIASPTAGTTSTPFGSTPIRGEQAALEGVAAPANSRTGVLGPAIDAEEQKLTQAVTNWEERKAAVDAWVAKYKNPRIRTEADWSPGGGRSGGMPVVRGRMNTPLAEDVMVEQSGGGIRAIGEGVDKLESVTPNTRILAHANHADYEAGAQLDEAYADALHRARLAETPQLRAHALEDAADYERQSHAFLRDHSPQNKAVIDRIEAVRKEAGTTGYHAAEARVEKLAARDAAAVRSGRGRVDPEQEAEYQATLAGHGPRGPVDTSWMDKYAPAKPATFVEEAHEATQVLGAYEKANAELAEAVGDAAPQSAKEAAAGYRAAESTAERKTYARSARAVDDSRTEAATTGGKAENIAGGKSQAAPPSATTEPPLSTKTPKSDNSPIFTEAQRKRMAEIKLESAEGDLAAKRRLNELRVGKAEKARTRAPGETDATAPDSKPTGYFEHVKNAASLVELAGGIPGMPSPHDLPVVGPLLGLYLKFRALKALAGKMGGRIGASGDAKAAALASKTRDAVAQSVDRMLGLAERVAPTARTVAAVAGAKVANVLEERLFDDGRPQPSKGAPAGELAAARAREVRAAASNPDALLAEVRKQTRDIADPDLIAAAEQQQLRKFQYLASVAPMPPPADPLGGAKWVPSPSDAARFARCIEIANDPVAALRMVETAQLTPEGAHALRAVYPKLFADAQQRMLRQVAQVQPGAAPIPYAQRCRMSLLFDVPLSPSLAPSAIASFQATHADSRGPISPSPTTAPPMPSIAASKVDLGALVATASDRRASRR